MESGTHVTSAREDILRRVRTALTDSSVPTPISRAYHRAGSLSVPDRVALFCERAGEYRADVRRVEIDDLGSAVTEICRDRTTTRLLVPVGVPAAWRPVGPEIVEDLSLSAHDLDAVDGVLTGCSIAIAETGTIALTSSPLEGRRALTLVPDLHICVVRETQIVDRLPDALAALADSIVYERRPTTFVSGPSATSDIELSRVEGVHGPRSLVILVTTEAGSIRALYGSSMASTK